MFDTCNNILSKALCLLCGVFGIMYIGNVVSI